MQKVKLGGVHLVAVNPGQCLQEKAFFIAGTGHFSSDHITAKGKPVVDDGKAAAHAVAACAARYQALARVELQVGAALAEYFVEGLVGGGKEGKFPVAAQAGAGAVF